MSNLQIIKQKASCGERSFKEHLHVAFEKYEDKELVLKGKYPPIYFYVGNRTIQTRQ
jgi:hypothetical protein